MENSNKPFIDYTGRWHFEPVKPYPPSKKKLKEIPVKDLDGMSLIDAHHMLINKYGKSADIKFIELGDYYCGYFLGVLVEHDYSSYPALLAKYKEELKKYNKWLKIDKPKAEAEWNKQRETKPNNSKPKKKK